MTPKMLKALKGSIEKWHKIVHHGGEDYGIDNCSLCQACIEEAPWIPNCTICPVGQYTGDDDCYGSPYEAWSKAEYEGGFHFDRTITGRKNGYALALKELEFLVTLLPEGEEAPMKDGWIWYWRWQ